MTLRTSTAFALGMALTAAVALAQEKPAPADRPAEAKDSKRAADAKETKGEPGTAKPQEIRVGVYVLSLGKLDISSGAFAVDFYLDLKSREPIADNAFEFMNGRAGSVEKIEDKHEGDTYEKFYRILANLNTPIDLKRFPFDSQRMQIILENKTESDAKVVYIPAQEESGLDPAIIFPGWQIKGWNAGTATHDYPVYGENFSQYIYTVSIQRIKWNSFLKTFLPVLVLMLIVLTSFILNPDQITTRLAAISSALVASVMFHVSISSQIPPVGYLTFADKFMGATYVILLASFFLSIRIFVLQGRKETDKAMKLHKATESIVFIGMPLLYVLLFLLVK